MRDEPWRCRHMRAEFIDLLLPRLGLPRVGEAVLHIAEWRLPLEGREVDADDGPLAQEARRAPEELEVATHARLVCVNDHNVEWLELAGACLLCHALKGLARRADVHGDLVTSLAFRTEALTERHDIRVDLQRVHLHVVWERLGHRQRRVAAEAADLQHAAGLRRGCHSREKSATLRRGRPVRAHADAGQALLIVPCPVLILHGLLKLQQR
mmetsp:Transcript_69332/g.178684  ORF Transcript_69332/g.178684 Transcript_69332/m.178684 type:complete len:211 (-) Transcript_69332:192-824(-)